MNRQSVAAAILVLITGTAWAQQADLVLTKSAAPNPVVLGSQLTYTLGVSNLGPDPAVSVTVTDPLPEGFIFLAASPECSFDGGHLVYCSVPVLPPSAIAEFTVVVEAPAPSQSPYLGVYLSATASTDASPALFFLDALMALRKPLATGVPLVNPRGVATLPDDALIVADQGQPQPMSGGGPLYDGTLVRVDRATGEHTILSAGGMMVNPTGVAVAEDGMVYVADPDAVPEAEGGRLFRVDPSTGEQSVVTEPGLLVRPAGVAVDGDGSLLVTDMLGRLVRVDPASGAQTLIIQDDHLWGAHGVAVEEGGTAVVAVDWAGILRVDLATGEKSVLAEVDGIDMVSPADVEVSPEGVVYVADPFTYDVGAILKVDPVSGDVLVGYMGNPSTGYRNPRGLELKDIALNVADVTAETTDPNPDNNLAFAGVEVLESGVPQPVEIIVVEQIGVSDSVAVAPAVLVMVNEGISVTDSAAPLPAVFLAVTEQIGVADAVAVGEMLPVQITVTEHVSVSDSVDTKPAVMLVVTEQIGVSDQVMARPAVLVFVNESVQVTDVVVVDVAGDEPPRVDWIGSVAGAADGEYITAAVTQVLLRFSERVDDPPGNSDPDDVTNPNNQLLLTDGGDGVFQTVDCATGVDPDDLPVEVHQVLYLDDLKLSAAQLGDRPLPASRYRLYVCGTTSIVDLTGNPLDGDGDGQGGDDLVVEFEVTADNLLVNPNYDADLEGWTIATPDGGQVEFDNIDVDDAPTSGSARLANLGSTQELALGQCATVPGEGWYRAGGRLHIDLLAPGEPSPRLELQWFGQPGCQQPISEASQLQLQVPEQGLWSVQERFAEAPVGAVSAQFTLVIVTDPGEDHETHWDSAMFFRDDTVIFVDGFESGDTSAWD